MADPPLGVSGELPLALLPRLLLLLWELPVARVVGEAGAWCGPRSAERPESGSTRTGRCLSGLGLSAVDEAADGLGVCGAPVTARSEPEEAIGVDEAGGAVAISEEAELDGCWCTEL